MPSPEAMIRAADRRVEILKLIRTSIRARGFPPSTSELAGGTGVSKRQIRTDLDVLAAGGQITREPGVARGIRVLPDPKAAGA